MTVSHKKTKNRHCDSKIFPSSFYKGICQFIYSRCEETRNNVPICVFVVITKYVCMLKWEKINDQIVTENENINYVCVYPFISLEVINIS